MKQFVVNTKDGDEVVFNFPNSIKEISNDYLTKITDTIHVADNYSLIALCYTERLSKIIIAGRAGKKDSKIKVTPIFVKAGKCDIDFINNAKMKQRVVSMPTQISLGTHVIVPNHKLTLDTFIIAITNTADNNIYEKELANPDQRDCIFIEFKLIPNSDIMGLIDYEISNADNPYVTINHKVVNAGE